MSPASLDDRRAGFVVPLFSLRREHDSGIGEILDLIPLLAWAAGAGQRVVQLLPINETAAGEASPYNSLSAFAIDPIYVSMHAVPHASPIPPVRRDGGPLPRAAIREAKLRALAAAFDAFRRAPQPRGRFGAFIDANREWLDDYALFRALQEEHGAAAWAAWPPPLRDRDANALAQVAVRLQSRIDFFRYVQWIAAEQWARVRNAAAAARVWLTGDLPFVIGRDSADVWAHQEEFDFAYSVGAPPDDFSVTGQSWGLPMYDWARVRATDFAWWRCRVRHAAALYDAFRIDHVIGFFRTYAIPHDPTMPRGFVPGDEPAQREQGEAFLRAILDAGRGALAIAEDLGSVPSWVRDMLRRFGIPGYKVFRWERTGHAYRDPRLYDPLSIATTGTHDTDTLAAWWAALTPAGRANVLDSLSVKAASPSDTLQAPLLHALLGRLYEAGSALVILPIQDLFGWTERINVPATPSGQNWNWRLPVSIERLSREPAWRDAGTTLRRLVAAAGRATTHD